MNGNENNKLPIKLNTTLAEAVSYFIKASGLAQIIRDIVSDEMRNNVAHSTQESKEQTPEFYTKSEVCQFLHISEVTLWRYVNKKKVIREYKMGGKNLYLRSEVLDLIKSGALKDPSSIPSDTDK